VQHGQTLSTSKNDIVINNNKPAKKQMKACQWTYSCSAKPFEIHKYMFVETFWKYTLQWSDYCPCRGGGLRTGGGDPEGVIP
jgi:hypothetical protein